ncbi:unnamed protein product [Schistosoma intercalatum]|nr:unnamed protein product [Schistosoma intercalatum]
MKPRTFTQWFIFSITNDSGSKPKVYLWSLTGVCELKFALEHFMSLCLSEACTVGDCCLLLSLIDILFKCH